MNVRWGPVCDFDCQVVLFFGTGRGSGCAALGVGLWDDAGVSESVELE